MSDRPLILFPIPEQANREKIKPRFRRTTFPSYDRQFERLEPSFTVLLNKKI